MGKKYIIELEEPEMFDERKYYQCSQMPWLAVSENVVENLTPYTEPDIEQVRKEGYEKGYVSGSKEDFDEAYLTGYNQGLADAWEAVKKLARMDTDTSESITGYFGLHNIMHNLTASEVIEKIRQYEQRQEEQDGLRQNIQTIVDKCGYSLDEIATVLEKMRGEQDG